MATDVKKIKFVYFVKGVSNSIIGKIHVFLVFYSL